MHIIFANPYMFIQWSPLILATSGPAKNGHYNQQPL